jgi:opacity protein-like surface antigen
MRKFVLAVGLVLMASSAQAATLDVVGGQLHGAFGVDVNGSLYDVEFLGGTCIELFDGCDAPRKGPPSPDEATRPLPGAHESEPT